MRKARCAITLPFAKEVGQLTNEPSENQAPNPSYRFYMSRSNQRGGRFGLA